MVVPGWDFAFSSAAGSLTGRLFHGAVKLSYSLKIPVIIGSSAWSCSSCGWRAPSLSRELVLCLLLSITCQSDPSVITNSHVFSFSSSSPWSHVPPMAHRAPQGGDLAPQICCHFVQQLPWPRSRAHGALARLSTGVPPQPSQIQHQNQSPDSLCTPNRDSWQSLTSRCQTALCLLGFYLQLIS